MQGWYFTHIRHHVPNGAFFLSFGVRGVITDVIIHAKFIVNRFRGFWPPGNFSISIGLAGRSYNSISTAMLHCDGDIPPKTDPNSNLSPSLYDLRIPEHNLTPLTLHKPRKVNSTGPTRTPTPTRTSSPTSARGSSRGCQRPWRLPVQLARSRTRTMILADLSDTPRDFPREDPREDVR